TWKTVGSSASNAPFTILDGGTPVATVAVNEQLAPADFSVNDTSWKGLGTYTITGNRLSVQLSNLANGTVVAGAPPPLSPGAAARASAGRECAINAGAFDVAFERVRETARDRGPAPLGGRGREHGGLARHRRAHRRPAGQHAWSGRRPHHHAGQQRRRLGLVR